MSRGIMATVSAALSNKALEMSDEEIRSVYEKAYGNEFFIELLPPTVLPATADVIGSNAHIQVAVDRRAGLLYGFSAIDNLNRGTAGQAIQSLNIALGLPEDAGFNQDWSCTMSVVLLKVFLLPEYEEEFPQLKVKRRGCCGE